MKKGFTLIELLGVITIVAIIMIIAIPNYLSTKKTTETALNDLEKKNIMEAIKTYKLDHPNVTSVNLDTLKNNGYIELNRTCTVNTQIDITSIDDVNLDNIKCTNENNPSGEEYLDR